MIILNSQETAPVAGQHTSVQAPPQNPPGHGKAIASLVLAILAPLSLAVTRSLAAVALLLTFPYNGPSKFPWVAPLVLWSLPMVFGAISTGLAISVIRSPTQQGFSKGMSTASLCVSGVVFVIGIIVSVSLMNVMY
ncbi:hypothetical protein ACFVVC_09170 [Pseudarthrobacter sp. NPDC058196]|uniref:hypothetical protein n=1 Tax=Pseudarthrobacter sp. NPDC058196 TaxID=3346376 RepID=UPI0036D96FCF